MKMKLLTAFACVALVFSACSKDNATDGNDGKNTPIGDEAWVAVSLNNQLASGTRALNNPNIDNGTADENKIEAVRAIFFDATGNITKDVVLSSNQVGTPGLPGGSGATNGEAFKVPSTSTQMLIITNAPSTFPAAPLTGTYDAAVNAVRTSADLAELTSTSTGFMMTNAKGELEAITLYPTAALAEAAPTAVNIDRVVAKVQVIAENPSSSTADVTITNVGWRLNVTNKEYFPVSKRTKTYLGTATPMDIYGLGSYRVDPNYTGNTVAAQKYDFFEQVNYSTISWNAAGTSAAPLFEYCLENTQDATDNVEAYTTQALIKASYTPGKFYMPGDTDGNPSGLPDASGDWFMIGRGGANTFYTYESLVAYIEEELTARFQQIESGNPDNVQTPITTSYNDFLAIEAGGAVPLAYIQGDGVSAKVGAAVLVFKTKNATVAALTEGKTVGNCNFYKGGVSFWKVMIKHDNDDSDAVVNELGEFGVVRNSRYDIKINKFNSPGFPTIPVPDPTIPDEDINGWLSVEINVNPWTWYSQEVDL